LNDVHIYLISALPDTGHWFPIPEYSGSISPAMAHTSADFVAFLTGIVLDQRLASTSGERARGGSDPTG
jgi:hypothetical protein